MPGSSVVNDTPLAAATASMRGATPVTPTAAAAAAAAAALNGGGSSDPASTAAATGTSAAPPVEKIRRYVSASCGRCGYHLSNWTVRTPARRAPLPNASGEQQQNPESSPSGCGATSVRASTPTPGLSPPSLTRVESEPPSLVKAASASVEDGGGDGQQQQLGPLLEPDPSDLFPSHVKSTYLGPEHVQLFPNVEGARNLLGRAVLLDPKHAEQAGDGGANKEQSEDDEEFEENGPKGRGGGEGHQRPSDRVTLALICPHCSFMLASSPTSPTLGLKGRFVVYQSSLRLSSTTDVPSPCTEPNSPTQPLGPSDFGALKPSYHDALPLIYDREEFEEVLLRSALAPGTATSSGGIRAAVRRTSYGDVMLDATKSEDDETKDFIANSKEEGDSDEGEDDNEDDDIYGITNPAELVILSVGQFWCPFSVSAVTRLSDYRRRQGMIMHDKNSGGSGSRSNKSLGVGGGGGTGGEAGSLTRGVGAAAEGRRGAPTDLAGLGYRQGISSLADSDSNQASSVRFNSNDSPSPSPNRSTHDSTSKVTPGNSRSSSLASNKAEGPRPYSHRRTASVPATFPADMARKPHHKVSKSGGFENGSSASNSNSNRNATLRSPCTFLLLDSFYHGESGGGVDPSQVLRPDLANDVKELPIPCFLVWYRGCRVNVTNASQHFRCLKGAVIGLDLARYVDIVVPRIAAEARAAFGRCGVSTPSDVRAREDTRTKLGGAGLGGLGDLLEGAKSNDVIWADVGDVPDLDDRPILDIKL